MDHQSLYLSKLGQVGNTAGLSPRLSLTQELSHAPPSPQKNDPARLTPIIVIYDGYTYDITEIAVETAAMVPFWGTDFPEPRGRRNNTARHALTRGDTIHIRGNTPQHQDPCQPS